MSANPGDPLKHAHSKPRLGRGLSSLIPGHAEAIPADDQSYQHVTGLPPVAPPATSVAPQVPQAAAPSQARPEEIRIDDITPNPYQPRR